MKIACYNVYIGGFTSYDSIDRKPSRIVEIRKAVKAIGADFIGLIDTFRWKDIYSEEDLKKIFGYSQSYHINIDDETVNTKIGITVLSNYPIHSFQTISLGLRKCVKAVITLNGKQIDIYILYLNHFKEAIRLQQIHALFKQLTSKSVVFMGDFNALYPDDAKRLRFNPRLTWQFLTQNFSLLFRNEFWLEYFPSFRELTKAKVIPVILEKGFIDAREKEKREATVFTNLAEIHQGSHFAVDHIFTTNDIKTSNFIDFRGNIFEKASDHYPIAVEIA